VNWPKESADCGKFKYTKIMNVNIKMRELQISPIEQSGKKYHDSSYGYRIMPWNMRESYSQTVVPT
jgi:hypothetical protein